MNEQTVQSAPRRAAPQQEGRVTVTDHPAPQDALRQHLGETCGARFLPAADFTGRVSRATACGLSPEDAERVALSGLARDEALLRAHGLTWRVVEVTARVGCGEHTVTPVLACYPDAVEQAALLALSLARQDAADWARLGLN